MSKTTVITSAPCGCESVLFHSSCRLVRASAHDGEPEDPRIHCDAEDGSVWLHAFGHVQRMPPAEARTLSEDLAACVRAAEKQQR